MSSEIIRRRAMYQAKIDEYEGFDFGVVAGNDVNVWGCFAVSPLIEIPAGCANIRYRNGSPNGFIRIAFCDENGTGVGSQVNYPTNSGGRETINTTIQSSYKYIRICVNIDDIDNCYIKDVTNNTYIWKGKNVT